MTPADADDFARPLELAQPRTEYGPRAFARRTAGSRQETGESAPHGDDEKRQPVAPITYDDSTSSS